MSELIALEELPESLVEFNRARIKDEVASGIYELMQKHGVNRSRLAKLLGVTKGRITHILSGEQNFRLETLADVLLVLRRAVHVTLGTDVDEFRLPCDEAIEHITYEAAADTKGGDRGNRTAESATRWDRFENGGFRKYENPFPRAGRIRVTTGPADCVGRPRAPYIAR